MFFFDLAFAFGVDLIHICSTNSTMSKFYVIQVLNTSINDNIGKLHISAGKVSNICISE